MRWGRRILATKFTDWIDLYQVHRAHTDVEVTLSALGDLIHQGELR